MNYKNLQDILEKLYDSEIEELEDELSEELPNKLSDAINLIEEVYPEYTTHLGYYLMILKQDLQNEKSN